MKINWMGIEMETQIKQTSEIQTEVKAGEQIYYYNKKKKVTKNAKQNKKHS